ncbi:MAG: type I-E CRISPR-associated protein Cse1/CasA [marine bacterium B5-7]|nr:MAG: type I-E CRISPR-associated protein Cse1/CasA [marine bacterium B5-7]
MNLINDPWIPVECPSGVDLIAPWQITDTENPVRRLASPRPDFNGALLQFLIGLLQTTSPAENHNQWVDWLEQPPSPEILHEIFARYSHAFNLDGDGPLFMQDYDKLEGDPKPVAYLLIDAPGAQTQKINADHFVKRGLVGVICPACTASALFNLQTNAPSGGAGHRTSLRGGGPLTTVVAIDSYGENALNDDLWRAVWLNVLDKSTLSSLSGNSDITDESGIFPWLGTTRTSGPDSGQDTTPLDAHPLQMYWSMPRRIRIQWESIHEGECDLCGTSSERLVRQYVTQNYGINYTGAWQHPLSPYYLSNSNEALPRHPQPGGVNYKHWLSLIQDTDNSFRALVVKVFDAPTGSRKLASEQLRLHTFGYDMDNMKARCWYETTFPLFTLDESIREAFAVRAHTLINAATETANWTRRCIKDAWFKRPGDAKGDTDFLVEAFLSHTEQAFFNQVRQLIDQLGAGHDGTQSSHGWHTTLCRSAIELFDYWTSRGDFEAIDPRRVAEAHQKLTGWMYGKNKGLPKILEINLNEKNAA